MKARYALVFVAIATLAAAAWRTGTRATRPASAAPTHDVPALQDSAGAESAQRELATPDVSAAFTNSVSLGAVRFGGKADGTVTLDLAIASITRDSVEGAITASLTDSDGIEHRRSADADLGDVLFRGLAAARFHLVVVCDGYRSVVRDLDLSSSVNATARVHVTLVPNSVIAIRARTAAGGPFTDVAYQLEVSPGPLFDGGFRVWRSSTGGDGDERELLECASAVERRFCATPGAGDEDVVGWIAGPELGGSWIGLELLGRVLEWQFVGREASELVYTIGADDLRRALSSIALSVVDARTHAPIDAAEARLEVRGARPAILDSTGLDGAGRVEFSLLTADTYTLIVSAAGYTERRKRLELALGQRLELGEIALELARPLRVHVVDRDGTPQVARVFVGPYVEGGAVDELLSKYFVATDESGVATLPAPATATIVRATARTPEWIAASLSEIVSRTVLIETERVPATLELVLWTPSLVDVTCAPELGRCGLALETDFGLRLATSAAPSLDHYLPPGRYVVVARDEQHAEQARRAFDVVEGQLVSITLP